jgi:hypothetical protein
MRFLARERLRFRFVEIANVNHFESLRARMSNEFSAGAYYSKL